MTQPLKRFDAQEARALCDAKKMAKVEILKALIGLAERKIECASALTHYATRFDTPATMIGFPIYDPVDMAKTLQLYFISRGFNVARAFHILGISWKPVEVPPTPPPTNQQTALVVSKKVVGSKSKGKGGGGRRSKQVARILEGLSGVKM